MSSVEEHRASMKKLRRAGLGAYVVLTGQAGKSGLSTQFPIGQITSFRDPWTVGVRKLGQRGATGYAAAFWEPAPSRLVNYLK